MRNFIILIIIIIIIIILIITYRLSTFKNVEYWKNRNEVLHYKLIKLLKLSFYKLESNNIKPFLIGGALLGSIRSEDLIPWDDDIDIGIYHKNGEKNKIIQKIKYIFKDVENIIIRDAFFGLKIHKDKHCCIDIFLFTDIYPDKIDFTSTVCRNEWPNNWLRKEELYNLDKCILRGVKYSCPSNIKNVLKRWYGEKCLDVSYLTEIHNGSHFDKLILYLFGPIKMK